MKIQLRDPDKGNSLEGLPEADACLMRSLQIDDGGRETPGSSDNPQPMKSNN